MKNHLLALSVAVLAAISPTSLSAAEKIKVLIADGPQKAHKYLETTPIDRCGKIFPKCRMHAPA